MKMNISAWLKGVAPGKAAAVISSGLIIILLLSRPVPPSFALNYFENLIVSFGNIAGAGWFADIAQDFVGFRAIIDRTNAYDIQGVMFKTIGVTLNVPHASTHPPTAYLLTAPIAYLPYPQALSLWSILMLITIPISVLLFGFSIRWALASVLIGLFWPPVFTALGQLTPLWLLGTALAYHYRDRIPILSGVGIAFASLTKYLPAILILIPLKQKKWKAVFSFCLVWCIVIGILIALNPGVIQQYLIANKTTSLDMIQRVDNGAFFAVLYRAAGLPGMILGVVFLLAVCLSVDHSVDSLWMLGCWLAVALLPIAWCYSILPLLPILLFALKKQDKFLPALVAVTALLPVPVQYGTIAAYLVTGTILLSGLILIYLPVKSEKWITPSEVTA
jgi:hypothetical protein